MLEFVSAVFGAFLQQTDERNIQTIPKIYKNNWVTFQDYNILDCDYKAKNWHINNNKAKNASVILKNILVKYLVNVKKKKGVKMLNRFFQGIQHLKENLDKKENSNNR